MNTDVTTLNIPITFFNNIEQMLKELALTGMREEDRKFFVEYFKGIAWSETTDGRIAIYPNVVNFIRENTPIFNS